MLLRYLPTLIVALALAGGVWWVMDLRATNAKLTTENAALSRSVDALRDQAAAARLAADVARAEAERQRTLAAEYEQVKDAFRKGDFDAPLPDDFRVLLDRILRPRDATPD